VSDTDTRRYKVLGTTEDADGCFCCGRTNLKVYVAMEDLVDGGLAYFGTTCAAAMEKVTEKVIRAEVKAVEAEKAAAVAAEKRAASEARSAAFLAWVAETHGVHAQQESDLWGKVEGKSPFNLLQDFHAAGAQS
jgi:hypothetical protein